MGKIRESALKGYKHLNGGLIQLLDGAAEVTKEVKIGWSIVESTKAIYVTFNNDIAFDSSVEMIHLMGSGKIRYEATPEFEVKNRAWKMELNAVEEKEEAAAE